MKALPVLLPLACLLALSACGGEEGPGRTEGPEADRLRARAEALFVEDKKVEAADTLAPLVSGDDAAAEDLVRAGIIQLALLRLDEARVYADRAVAAAPDDPRAAFLHGNVLLKQLDYTLAAQDYRRVLAVAPDDLAAHYQLAEALDYDGQTEAALAEYGIVRAAGIEADGPLYKATINKIANMLIRERRVDEALALRKESAELDQQGIVSPSPSDIEARGYGRLLAPVQMPVPLAAPVKGPWPGFSGEGQAVPTGAMEHLLVADVDADGLPDVVAWGKAGLAVARQQPDGSFEVETLRGEPVLDVAVGDLDVGSGEVDSRTKALLNDRTSLELVVVDASGGERGGSWSIQGLEESGRWVSLGPNGIQGADTRAALCSDFDHDGQLDVVLATGRGLRLMRNHGALRTDMTPFPDATPDALSRLGDVRGVIAEDFDGDNDVDYLALGAGSLALLSNLRGGAFEDVSADWNLPELGNAGLLAEDLDEDGRPDLLLCGARGASWARNDGHRFSAVAPITADDTSGSILADLDLDGHVDLITPTANDIVARHGPLAHRTAEPAAQRLGAVVDRPASEVAVADMNGDGAPDVVANGPLNITMAWAGPLPGAHALPLSLQGTKDNAYGVGAVVELRAGPIYRRVYWRGAPLIFGLGAQTQADVLAFTWPNGVIQRSLDVPADASVDVTQVNRVSGSCPFLYTWNGERFEFVTDVLGATPLGLPLAPGMMVPFDHEEYVKVRGDQLQPREDGRLVLALTEELREVTYLDRVRLHAIDHPAAVEIQPNEGFVFPPFPPHHVHTFSDVTAPARILASDGSDLTERLSTVDGRSARPFVKLPPVYRGLAEPWWLELVLADTPEQRAALAAAPRIRLALTGWLQWGDASVNMAAARHPTVAFEPPVLSVPDGDGWRAAGPPIGFPAGKTKTLVVDITDLVDRDDPRLRLDTTLQLTWDAIRVVLDADDAPYRDTALEAGRASLAFRGFSEPVTDPEGELPELFDWDRVYHARWNQHPGRYTRYGDVLPLLGTVDDMYVILGAGDAIEVAFDSTALPALPAGWTRDWLLYLDGWAKDRDPNTVAAERVEPLPFHAMSAYPPPAGESFPWDAAHLTWDAQWNTRPGATLIEPLARAPVGAGAR